MRIIGLDLSLAHTGVAVLDPGGTLALETIEPKSSMFHNGEERLLWITSQIMAEVQVVDVVVIEGPSLHSRGSSTDQTFALNWMVRCWMWSRKIRYFVCPPTTLKAFTTGVGNAKKDLMLREVWKRWQVNAADDNQADAAALAYLGACLVGEREPENEAQRRAVASILTPKAKKARKVA